MIPYAVVLAYLLISSMASKVLPPVDFKAVSHETSQKDCNGNEDKSKCTAGRCPNKGSVAERSIAPVLKTGEPERAP